MDEKQNVFFSIIVPVHNTEKYLNDCIQSVLEQNVENYEIILVDDGSTDLSGEMCDEYTRGCSAISVIHQENKGLSEARNSGMKVAKGKYLVFLDSDDMLAKNSLSGIDDAIEKNEFPDIVVSRRETFSGKEYVEQCQYYFDENKLDQMNRTEKYNALQSMRDCWLGAWIFTISNDFVKKNQLYFYPGILHEDEEWVPRIFFNANSIGFNNNYLYRNRVNRPGSITSTPNIKRLFDRLFIVDLLTCEFEKAKYLDKERDAINQRISKIVFGVLCKASEYKNDIRYDELLQKLKKKISLLVLSNQRKHKIAYFACSVFGCKACSLALKMINN